jgi:rubrerythrin
MKTTTEENLKEAFSGESQANRRYLAFSKKAGEEGFKQIAKLFKVIAKSETIHALNHLKILREVKSTEENLNLSIKGENYEFSQMYPKFIDDAGRVGESDAMRSFTLAKKVEKLHEKLFKEALMNVKLKRDLEPRDYWVCQNCGYLSDTEAPQVCPVCGAMKEKFRLID